MPGAKGDCLHRLVMWLMLHISVVVEFVNILTTCPGLNKVKWLGSLAKGLECSVYCTVGPAFDGQ